MKHTMHLSEFPFSNVLAGYKTCDLRVYDEKRQKVRPGDEIRYYNLDDSGAYVDVVVVGVSVFRKWRDLYDELNLLKCGYKAKDLPFAKPDDMYDYYESKADEEKYGVCGIHFQLK